MKNALWRSLVFCLLSSCVLSPIALADETPAVEQVSPDTFPCSDAATFENTPLGKYDTVLQVGNYTFAEHFKGQGFVPNASNTFDILEREASNPLTVEAPFPDAQGFIHNIGIAEYPPESNNISIVGFGPLPIPNGAGSTFGEGSIAVLFADDHSRVSFDVYGNNNGAARAHFFRRDGSLIESIRFDTNSDGRYAFRRTGDIPDIAGFSIHNTDEDGLAYDNICASSNAPPSVSVNNASGDEGAAIRILAAVIDPDNIPTTTWTYAAGSNVSPGATCHFSNPASVFTSITCTDNGTYSITLTADDGFNPPLSDTATVTIGNVAPSAIIGVPAAVNEGTAITLTLSAAFDPSSVDTAAGLHYAFDCGTGSGFGAFGPASTAMCATTDDGSRSVRARIRDKDGGETSYEATVTIDNVAPTGTFEAPSPIDEGGVSTLSLANAADASADDTASGFRFSFACDGLDNSLATEFASAATSTNAICAFPDDGDYTVKGRIFDKDNGFTTYENHVIVNNAAPSLGPIAAPMTPIRVNAQFEAMAPFTDRGVLDTHMGVWTWGDGSTSSAAISETSGSGTAAGSHAYATSGLYSVELTITDDDYASDQARFQFVIVYDPDGGFVTGGGGIDSSAGRASFGFNAKYEKGAAAPSGQTEFQVPSAKLNFHSSSYAWLVVAAGKAKLRGVGTINGGGDYSFLLSVVDGSSDRFWIRIWDQTTGVDIFNNQPGAADDADATAVVSRGSIVVHNRR